MTNATLQKLIDWHAPLLTQPSHKGKTQLKKEHSKSGKLPWYHKKIRKCWQILQRGCQACFSFAGTTCVFSFSAFCTRSSTPNTFVASFPLQKHIRTTCTFCVHHLHIPMSRFAEQVFQLEECRFVMNPGFSVDRSDSKNYELLADSSSDLGTLRGKLCDGSRRAPKESIHFTILPAPAFCGGVGDAMLG